jgi:peptidoglycan/xylan/chitin deacetylase (PgdA/CDA1 family)
VRCQEALATITGTPPTLVRPPYGGRDFRFYRIARRLGLTPVLWSLDSRDWIGGDPPAVLARLGRVRAGDVVLLHDGDPGARSTAAALDRWLAAPVPAPLERLA